jgi:hypothetical protein
MASNSIVAEIRERWSNDSVFLAKCIVIIYNRQEADERAAIAQDWSM